MRSLDVHIETKIDVARGLSSANPPVPEGDLPEKDLDVVPGDAERLKSPNDALVEVPLRIERAAGDAVDRDVGVALGAGPVGWTGEAVRFMNDQADGPVGGQDLEGLTQRGVDSVDDPGLLCREYGRRTSIRTLGTLGLS